MTTTLIQLSPDELQQTISNAVEAALKRVTPQAAPKLLLTVKEVGEQIGYSKSTVLTFVHQGRKARSGKEIRLPVVEITTGDFRVKADDLAAWISHF